jgi:hypothetical protein
MQLTLVECLLPSGVIRQWVKAPRAESFRIISVVAGRDCDVDRDQDKLPSPLTAGNSHSYALFVASAKDAVNA